VCFKVSEFTTKSQKITESFINQGTDIITLEMIISEIERKGIAKIVDEFCDSFEARSLVDLKNNNFCFEIIDLKEFIPL
jgi:signal-transduction protein with cAMP-binding, CBS, and nucleotidyltransferase domain